MTEQEQINKNNVIAIFYTVLGFFFLTVGDALTKMLVGSITPMLMTFLISIFAASMGIMIGGVKNGFSSLKTSHVKWHFVRGILMTFVSVANVIALQHIQLDEFYAVVFTAPLWVALLSYLILKDDIGKHRAFSLFIGFVIVLMMLRPGGGLLSFSALIVLAGTLCFALTIIIVRHVGDKEKPFLYAISAPLVATLLLAPVCIYQGAFEKMPSLPEWGILFVMSCFFLTGASFVVAGFQKTNAASVVAPFHYTQMIWGIALGYLIFGDAPASEALMGAGCLAIVGVYMVFREARANPTEKEALHTEAPDVLP